MPEERADSEMECGEIQSGPLYHRMGGWGRGGGGGGQGGDRLHHLERNLSIHYTSVKMQVAIR